VDPAVPAEGDAEAPTSNTATTDGDATAATNVEETEVEGSLECTQSVEEVKANKVEYERVLGQVLERSVEIFDVKPVTLQRRRQTEGAKILFRVQGSDAASVAAKVNAAASDPTSSLSKYGAVPNSASASSGSSGSNNESASLSPVAIGAIAAAGTVLLTGLVVGAVVVARRRSAPAEEQAATRRVNSRSVLVTPAEKYEPSSLSTSSEVVSMEDVECSSKTMEEPAQEGEIEVVYA